MFIKFPIPPSSVFSAANEPQTLNENEFRSIHTTEGREMLFEAKGFKAPRFSPHKIYSIDTTDLLEHDPLKSVKDLGWRSYSLGDTGQIASKLLVESAGGSRLEQVDINPLNKQLYEAFIDLSHLESGDDSRYEFRYLHLPQVYVAAIWLHRTGRDLFYPLPISFDIPTERLMEADEFFEYLKPLVAAARKRDI